jgi:hypothetical protein
MAMRGVPILLLLFAAWPRAAAAAPDPAPVRPPAIIPAPPDPLGDLAARQAAADAACRRVGFGDAILVCGRPARSGGGYRIPWVPEPGARVRLVAGEAPSATAAMSAGGCLRLCLEPVRVNIIQALRTLGRGLDRLLHPD